MNAFRGWAAGLALAAFAAGAHAQSLAVVGLDGRDVALDAARLANLPRARVTAGEGEHAALYEGPLLGQALREAGAPMGQRLHGAPLKAYVLVTGRDGFQAVFSLAELDKDFHGDTVILADRKDGVALDAKHGPWRVVSSGDRKGWRSVYAVERIEIRSAVEPSS